MTCFWRGLLQAFSTPELVNVLGPIANRKRPRRQWTPRELITKLQQNAVETDNVQWNGEDLSAKQLEENLEHIRCINKARVNQGYDCSTCDPVLLLMAQLFNVTIVHHYEYHRKRNLSKCIIRYTPTSNGINRTKRTVKFASNRNHFWYAR